MTLTSVYFTFFLIFCIFFHFFRNYWAFRGYIYKQHQFFRKFNKDTS